MKAAVLLLAIMADVAHAAEVAQADRRLGTFPRHNSNGAMVDDVSRRPIDPTLIGGQPADPKAWPASVYARAGNSACSATVVGEKALAIAAHCVSNGGSVTFSVGANQYSARCTHSPKYRGDSTADYALCAIDKVVTGIEYENLATDTSWCAVNAEVTLTGYGCVRSGGGGGNDGIYRIGTAKIITCPTRSNDTVTRGTAALCYGDSGGPAFYVKNGERVVFGVNSRGNISTTSYLSTWTTTDGKSFIASWASQTSLKLCGVHSDARGCRGAGEEPPPPPPPPRDCDEALAQAIQGQQEASSKLLVLKACLEAEGN